MGFPLFPVLDVFPRASVLELEKSEIPLEELVNIINWRFNSQRWANISTVMGDVDFLSFSVLEQGVKYGKAVCRLLYDVLNLPDEKLHKIKEKLYEIEEFKKKQLNQEELAEILGIEKQNFKSFFQGYTEYPLKDLTCEKLKKLMFIPVGTGFLVGPNYLLTNYHLLPEKSDADDLIAEFGYEQDFLGRNIEPIKYKLDPSFFVSNKELDYTLVKVQKTSISHPRMAFGEAGDYFGWIPMVEDNKTIAPPLSLKEAEDRAIIDQLSDKVQQRLKRPVALFGKEPGLLGEPGLPGEPVTIIQHPKGRYKQIVLFSNRLQRINNDFLYYEADSDYGSSGSPVFNQGWQLVALNRAAVAVDNENVEVGIIGYEGVRICKIIQNLKDKFQKIPGTKTPEAKIQDRDTDAVDFENYAEIQDFVDNFVAPAPKLQDPVENQPNLQPPYNPKNLPPQMQIAF
jgi:transcriptional regulator with XRE-family HTH domain